MKKTPIELAKDYLQHLSERNLGQLTAMFAEEVDWYVPGDVNKASWLGRLSSSNE